MQVSRKQSLTDSLFSRGSRFRLGHRKSILIRARLSDTMIASNPRSPFASRTTRVIHTRERCARERSWNLYVFISIDLHVRFTYGSDITSRRFKGRPRLCAKRNSWAATLRNWEPAKCRAWKRGWHTLNGLSPCIIMRHHASRKSHHQDKIALCRESSRATTCTFSVRQWRCYQQVRTAFRLSPLKLRLRNVFHAEWTLRLAVIRE